MPTQIKYWLIRVGTIISVIVLAITSGCGTGPGTFTSGQWQQTGLDGISINKLNLFEENIFAASDSGLYRMKKATDDWTSLGLTEEEVLDIAFLQDNKWLVAIRISDFSSGIPSLYLSSNEGQSWQTYMNNYGEETGKYTWIQSLATISKPSDTLFAIGGQAYVRSLNGGKHWELLGKRWDLWGELKFLIADSYHKGHIWIGGRNALSLPILAQSTDNGDTWQGLKIAEEGVETTVRDLWVAPEDTSTILITTGGIQRSADGGQNWQPVFEEAFISTFTHSARNPEVVYASGENADGTLFFAASRDFGDSWEMVEWEDSPAGVEVNDMATVMVDGREVLCLGTNNGVFTYRFEE